MNFLNLIEIKIQKKTKKNIGHNTHYLIYFYIGSH